MLFLQSLLPPLRRGLLISAPLLICSPLLVRHNIYRSPILCDSGAASPFHNTSASLGQDRKSIFNNPFKAQTVRQLSLGSILGLFAGLGVSLFSKPLAMLIGLGFLGVQFLESRGIHVIPYKFLQRRFQNINWKRVAQTNLPLKFSFGITFTLASFASF